MKWIIWWRDGDVSVWDVAFWPAAVVMALKNAIEVELVDTAAFPSIDEAVAWWNSDAQVETWPHSCP